MCWKWRDRPRAGIPGPPPTTCSTWTWTRTNWPGAIVRACDPLARREMTEELKRLLECVGRLEPDRQKLVLLAYYNGWSREQLAAKFETPVNTVKTWLRRSLMDIRECLGL